MIPVRDDCIASSGDGNVRRGEKGIELLKFKETGESRGDTNQTSKRGLSGI